MDKLVESEARSARHGTSDLRAATHPHAQPQSPLARSRQLRRDDHAKTGVRERTSAFAQELPCGGGGQLQVFRFGFSQRRAQWCEHPRRPAKGRKQRFLRIAKRAPQLREPPPSCAPSLGSRDQQARIVRRLQKKAKHERVTVPLW